MDRFDLFPCLNKIDFLECQHTSFTSISLYKTNGPIILSKILILSVDLHFNCSTLLACEYYQVYFRALYTVQSIVVTMGVGSLIPRVSLFVFCCLKKQGYGPQSCFLCHTQDSDISARRIIIFLCEKINGFVTKRKKIK